MLYQNSHDNNADKMRFWCTFNLAMNRRQMQEHFTVGSSEETIFLEGTFLGHPCRIKSPDTTVIICNEMDLSPVKNLISTTFQHEFKCNMQCYLQINKKSL